MDWHFSNSFSLLTLHRDLAGWSWVLLGSPLFTHLSIFGIAFVTTLLILSILVTTRSATTVSWPVILPTLPILLFPFLVFLVFISFTGSAVAVTASVWATTTTWSFTTFPFTLVLTFFTVPSSFLSVGVFLRLRSSSGSRISSCWNQAAITLTATVIDSV